MFCLHGQCNNRSFRLGWRHQLPVRAFFFERFVGTNLHQGQLHKKSLVLGAPVLHIGLVQDVQSTHEEKQICPGRLVLEFGLDVLRHFEELKRLGILCHHQISQVTGPSCDEVMRIETSRHDLIEEQHGTGNV